MQPDTFFNTWDSFLYNYHLYYRNLSQKGKERFMKRVESVLNNTIIIGKEELELNEQIEILVVANLVQLTFGLKQFWLYGYEYIYIYPDEFTIEATGQTVGGSTYNNKIISLSWKNFALDHLRPKDGKNISFAQYALALIRTVLNGKRFDLSFGSYLDTWFDIIKKESANKTDMEAVNNLSNNNDDLAFVFAKCTELFFEKPELFKKELPSSYAHFCLLLNQDPLNAQEDYAYNRNRLNKVTLKEPLPPFITKNYKYKTWHWSYNLAFFGFAICPMILYFLTDNILINTFQIITTIIAIGFVIAIVFYYPLKKAGLYNNPILLTLNSLFGIAPCLITLYLILNSIYGYPSTRQISRHKIASYYQTHSIRYANGISTTFNFSDSFLTDYPKARTFESFEEQTFRVATLFNGAEYEIRTGLLGLPILINRKLY